MPLFIENCDAWRKRALWSRNGRRERADQPGGVYSITSTGEDMLRGWTDVVSGYQRMITGFFDLYAQVFGLVLPTAEDRAADSPATAEPEEPGPESPPST